MISFIVPVFYKNKNSFIYKRSLELIAKFQNHPKIELIIADSSHSPKLQAQAKNIIIAHTKLHQKTFSLAQARNQAVQYATKKYLFFLDVDMDYSLEFEKLLFDEIQNELETNQLNFFQIPFLYLTPKGTQLFEKNHQLATLKEGFLKGKTCLVESISITNPSIVISKQYFQQIGGFDEDFYGHGCEDYILLHKLAAFNSHSKRNQDYYTDFKAHFLGDSKGFRKYFAYYSLPYFFKDLILLHRWHPRPFYNNFYSRRIPNETLLQSKMKQFDEDYKGKIWHSTKPLINLKEYITNLMLQHHYDPKEYPGFFSYAKGVKPPKKSINNKIRKLLTRPKDFFRDIKLFKKPNNLTTSLITINKKIYLFYYKIQKINTKPKDYLAILNFKEAATKHETFLSKCLPIHNTTQHNTTQHNTTQHETRRDETQDCFLGWGRKKSGQNAIALAKKFHGNYLLLEDGFIRSFGLGCEGSPSFSLVQDKIGIYYDSTTPSELENLLNTYDFHANPALLKTAKEAINLITTHHISKYNHAPEVPLDYFTTADSTKSDFIDSSNNSATLSGLTNSPYFEIYPDSTAKKSPKNTLKTAPHLQKALFVDSTAQSQTNQNPTPPKESQKNPKRILIISQTKGDCSLTYGSTEHFTTAQIIQDALRENPNSEIYLKIHPDVLSGHKESDFNPSKIPPQIKLITEDFNPISLLKHFHKVYTKTSQMGFEALLVGCECVCYGMPFYAGWGLTIDKQTCPRRTRKLSLIEVFAASYILYSCYYNPIYDKKSDILDTLKTIIHYKHFYTKTQKKAFMFGFSLWKHSFIPPFMPNFKPQNIIFINPLFTSHFKSALKKGLHQEALKKNCEIFIWGRKNFDRIESFAKENAIPITRIEDGFIRSISLGSDLTRPFSQVFDSQGIYFDSTAPSELEEILNHTDFSPTLLNEAKILKDKILANKISKYNTNPHKSLNFPQNKLKILIPGQVQDDASILYGANGRTNLSLLQQVREENPNAYILYKPHPDVLSGNRIGHIPQSTALQYCDEILTGISLSSCLEAVDEVHTLTSLSGFEALLYGKKVITYGMPFYAGWGLTIDKQACPRRTRRLTLEQLIAGAYILYPRYIHPKTLSLCHPNVLIDALKSERQKLQNNPFYAFKKRLYANLSRKTQKILRILAIK